MILKRVVQVLAVLVGIVVAYVGVTGLQVWLTSRRNDDHHAQAIVVFGAAQYDGRPSLVLQARLDHAADLYKKGYANVVWVTGGRQPGDRYTEASTGADYLARHGVPQAAVERENTGRTSWESLAAAARYLHAEHRTDVLLVSDPFHSARILAMAKELGLNAHVSPTRTSPIKGKTELRYLGRETVAMAAGRIVGFRRLVHVDTKVVRARALSH